MDFPDNLVKDYKSLGERLLKIRRNMGLSQEETAWAAGLSTRTYADIERGTVNARLDTILRICKVFRITPNDILVSEQDPDIIDMDKLDNLLKNLTEKQQKIAYKILMLYAEACLAIERK